MHHGHADDIYATLTGIVLSITLRVTGWVDLPSFGADVFSSLLVGIVGGIGGYLGKQLIEKLVKTNKQK